MDYQEKLVWGQFLPIVLGCAYYVVDTTRQAHGLKSWPLLAVLLVLLMLQVAYLILVAALSKPEPRDERTRLIENKGYKVGYLVVMVLFFVWLGADVIRIPGLPYILVEPTVAVFVWFAIEAVRTGTQLAMYRAAARP